MSGTNIDANTAAAINLTLHSMFRKIGLELNGRNVGNTSQLYPYRSDLDSSEFQQKKSEKHVFWARDGHGTPAGTWMSPESVETMSV